MERKTNNEVDEFTKRLLESNQKMMESAQQHKDDARYKELLKSSRNSIKNLFRRI